MDNGVNDEKQQSMQLSTTDKNAKLTKNANNNSDHASDGCCRTGLSWLDGVAAVAVGSSLLSYQVRDMLVTKTAAVSTLLLGPYAAFQRRKLRDLPSIRRCQNELRREINNFHIQNEVLRRKLQRLDVAVTNLERVEQELGRFATNRTELRKLEHIVQRQTQLNQKMKKCLQTQVLQNILSVVVQGDQNQDFQVAPQELEAMILRMKSITGVEFNERNFRAIMAAGDRRISSVFSMIRTLMKDDDDSNDVFTFHPEQLVLSHTNQVL